MTPLETALCELAESLTSLEVPYMTIGGLAVAFWQVPRATLDVDLTVWVDPNRRPTVAAALLQRFPSTTADPMRLLGETNVLPLIATNAVRVDLIFARLPFERHMLTRAVSHPLGSSAIQVASIEDLLLMKLISERPKDQADAQALIRRHRARIDRPYLDPLVEELALALDRPGLLSEYRALLEDKR